MSTNEDYRREVSVKGSTRGRTLRLRDAGTMKGWLVPDDISPDKAQRSAGDIDMRSVFEPATLDEVVRDPGGGATVLSVDVGVKDDMVSSTVIRAGRKENIAHLAREADGIVLRRVRGPAERRQLEKTSD